MEKYCGMGREQVGRVVVDTGMISIVDPASLAGSSSPAFPKPVPEGWRPTTLTNDHGVDVGAVVDGFGGDGVYPVFTERDEKGLVARCIVEFDPIIERSAGQEIQMEKYSGVPKERLAAVTLNVNLDLKNPHGYGGGWNTGSSIEHIEGKVARELSKKVEKAIKEKVGDIKAGLEKIEGEDAVEQVNKLLGDPEDTDHETLEYAGTGGPLAGLYGETLNMDGGIDSVSDHLDDFENRSPGVDREKFQLHVLEQVKEYVEEAVDKMAKGLKNPEVAKAVEVWSRKFRLTYWN